MSLVFVVGRVSGTADGHTTGLSTGKQVLTILLNKGAALGEIGVGEVQRQIGGRAPASTDREDTTLIRGNTYAAVLVVGRREI